MLSSESKWDIPRTEEGLQRLLAVLAEARATRDAVSEGRALIELSLLVKWVRSDNHQTPFERSHTLALEALKLYRRIGDKGGQISALLSAAPFEPPDYGMRMLSEAQELAEASGSDLDLARVISARARQLALSDRAQAAALTKQALAIYRKLGHAGGMAGCLFSLAISDGTAAEKKDRALEAALLYREAGNRSEAGKAMMIALMNVNDPAELAALEPEIMRALDDAQAAGDRYTEGRCYGYFAQIAEAKGQLEDAAKYLRWEADLRESDGLSPRERWKQNVEMTSMMIAMAKRNGNAEMVKSFEEELRRLKKEEP